MRPANKQPFKLKNDRWLFFLTAAFVSLLAGFTMWFSIVGEHKNTALAASADLRLPLADLDEDELNYFTYPVDSTTTVRFLVQRGPDGTPRVAFASCPRCYKYSRPSYEMWGYLVCGHCNHRMRLPNPGEEPTKKSGCVPVAIPFSVENGELIVHGHAIAEKFQRWYRPSRRQEQR